MNLFYADPSDINDNKIEISGQEAHHISKVLRYNIGDSIFVTDGIGFRYACKIDTISKGGVTALVKKTEFEERPNALITIAIGMIKKRDRLEFAVEKCTELGVNEIVLFKADHSEKTTVREDRIFNTVLSAMKQSLRVYLPGVQYFNTTDQMLSEIDKSYQIVIGDEEADKNSTDLIENGKNYFIIIGPEGGFSERERQMISKQSALRYSLGEKRLRTETAAVVMTDQFIRTYS